MANGKGRRPLEGGTLIGLYLGRRNLLARTNRLERQAGEVETSLLSLGAAGAGYTRQNQITLGGWGQTSISQSQSAVTLARFGSSHPNALVMPYAGVVTSLMVATTAPRTNGSLTITVYVAGVATDLAATIDDVTTQYTEERGEVSFEAGEAVTLRITTTGNWSPTSTDVQVLIRVALNG